MAKATETTATQPTVTKVGELNKEQIDALKKEHNCDKLKKIIVDVNAGEKSVCYLKPAGRDAIALAMSRRSQHKTVEAGEALIDNCFVGGDTRVKTVDSIRVAAAVEALKCVDFLEASSEEV